MSHNFIKITNKKIGELFMCLAVPGEIIEIRGKKALVDILGNTLEVSIELIVHAGCAISKVDKNEALETIKLFRELEELRDERNS